MSGDNTDTVFLAVTDKHGWARDDDKEQAVRNALEHSSYLNAGDTVNVHVYEVEPGTEVLNDGRIGVREEREEPDPYGREYYLRGSDPCIKDEKREYEVEEPTSWGSEYEFSHVSTEDWEDE